MAVSVSLNGAPAVCVPGVGTLRLLAPAGLTTKLAEVPETPLWVAVNVVAALAL